MDHDAEMSRRQGPTEVRPADPAGIARAAGVIRAGGLVAFPTETVYGLGADATSAEAVNRIFSAKGRPASDPLIVHVASLTAAEAVGDLDAGGGLARRLVADLWPGPLTVVVPRGPDGDVVAEVGGGATVALRCPAHPVALRLLQLVVVPIAAPSANRFGRVSPTAAPHVLEELEGRVDLVLDGGSTPLGVESTVVAAADGRVEVLRPGGVSVEDLVATLGGDHDAVSVPDRLVVGAGGPAPSPGMLAGHYAPRVPMTLVDAGPRVLEQLARGLRAMGLAVDVVHLPDGEGAARELYARLRALDHRGAEVALAGSVDPAGLGRAVNDRLFRAAHGHLAADATTSTVERIAARAHRQS